MLATGLAVVIAWERGLPAQKPVASVDSRTGVRWSVARTADGHPDMEGVWNFATLTPLVRPDRFAGRAFMTDEEAAAFEQNTLQGVNADRRGATGPPLVDGAAYNEFWFERGTLATIEGRKPTSLVVNPADGRIPALTADAQERQAQRAASGRRFDSPADFSLSERCLRSASGPPYLPTAPDGANLIRIVQTRGQVALVQEKFHETRIVPLDGRPLPSSPIRSWMGASRGHWDGDTLVVETAHFTGQLALGTRFDENLRLVERFTRVGPNTLLYEVTVDDPTFFTKPWTVRLPMTRTGEELHEFACHEGNYSLPNILRGARFQEQSDTSGSSARR